MAIQEFSREKELLYAGREEGIKVIVTTLARLNIPKSQPVEEIQNSYNLTTQEANDYVSRFY